MNLAALKQRLNEQPQLTVRLVLPDGDGVPAHIHVTEVGHVVKRFVDCGGTFRSAETCVLQTWMGSTGDDGHRLTAGRLARILELANSIMPTDNLPVEVEYEAGRVTQFPLQEIGVAGKFLELQLGTKHTDCLARETCGIRSGDTEGNRAASPGCAPAGGCCA